MIGWWPARDKWHTCGESLNMGAHTMSGVEWCFAASARVWVPATALREPFARIVFVPMITFGRRGNMSHAGGESKQALWLHSGLYLSIWRAHRPQRESSLLGSSRDYQVLVLPNMAWDGKLQHLRFFSHLSWKSSGAPPRKPRAWSFPAHRCHTLWA